MRAPRPGRLLGQESAAGEPRASHSSSGSEGGKRAAVKSAFIPKLPGGKHAPAGVPRAPIAARRSRHLRLVGLTALPMPPQAAAGAKNVGREPKEDPGFPGIRDGKRRALGGREIREISMEIEGGFD